MKSNRYYAAAVIWNRKEKTRALIEDREPVLRPENPEEEAEMNRKLRKNNWFMEPQESYRHTPIRNDLMEERQGKPGKGGKRKWGFNREHK
ncbi:hypothetical protein VPHK479_0078 [Vibrio phage K479]